MNRTIVLAGGTVLDGTGETATRADVLVRDGRIEAVGDLSAAVDADTVDVTGRVVAPGFIDVHAHTDLTPMLSDEHQPTKVAGIRQGVTTEVCGNCGSSPFPVREFDPDDPYLGSLPPEMRRGFANLADYRAALGEQALVANLAPLVGHGTLRTTVVGREDRPATPDELRELQRRTDEAMEQGAFGLSSGLIYAPGLFADTDELVALAEVAARHGRPYTTHMRDEGDAVVAAVEEALTIGRRSGAGVQISHHKAIGRRNWGRSQDTLVMIDRARESGVDVSVDVYPYTAGSTALAALLPPWVLAGGPDEALAHLRDTAAIERMRRDYEDGLPGWQNLVELAGWDNLVIAGGPPYAGRSLAEIAEDRGRHPLDVMVDRLLEDPMTIVILHMMDANEVVSIGEARFALVGSDGVPLPGMQHPRLAGTFARVLARAEGDLDTLAWTVHRMTGMPAARFGVPDRGEVRRGYVADLVVFDPSSVQDNATYLDPLLPPSGVDHVLVGGRFVVRDGALTAARPGAVLTPR
ncbi:MAG TPA: D-aminoacylase [Nitriliruptorales bacterium]